MSIKRRGLKRYYRSLRNSVAEWNFTTWPQNESFAFDFYGRNNAPNKHRKEHVKLLFDLYDNAEQQLDTYKIPHLTTVFYDDSNECQHLFSVMTGKELKLYWIKSVNWRIAIPKLVLPYLESRRLAVGQFAYERQTSFYHIIKRADLIE